MIIEYRVGSNPSTVKRTYKDISNVITRGNVMRLEGVIPTELDVETGYVTKWAQSYFIAAICLAPGEYLERIDVPRD